MSQNHSSARLSGRKILITGGASGIGSATARLFAEHGARVGVLDRDGEAASRLANEIGGVAAQADVADAAETRRAVEAIATGLGGLDGLVNCAGTFIPGKAEDGDLDGWNRTLAVNLTGAFLATAAALPFLKQAERATIVNISSGIALRPAPEQGAYAASKAGLLAWTKVLAQELGPRIRVNATCPGPTDTPLMRAHARGLSMKELGEGRALDRAGEPHEQAAAILFLTSDEASFVTGVTVPVDGGRTYY